MNRRQFTTMVLGTVLAGRGPVFAGDSAPAQLTLPPKDPWELALEAMSIEERAMHSLWLYDLERADQMEADGRLYPSDAHTIRTVTKSVMADHGTPDITAAQYRAWERNQSHPKRRCHDAEVRICRAAQLLPGRGVERCGSGARYPCSTMKARHSNTRTWKPTCRPRTVSTCDLRD